MQFSKLCFAFGLLVKVTKAGNRIDMVILLEGGFHRPTLEDTGNWFKILVTSIYCWYRNREVVSDPSTGFIDSDGCAGPEGMFK